MIAIIMGVWAKEVYSMFNWEYRVLKFKRELARRKKNVAHHNKKVDVLGRKNRVEKNVGYKRHIVATKKTDHL